MISVKTRASCKSIVRYEKQDCIKSLFNTHFLYHNFYAALFMFIPLTCLCQINENSPTLTVANASSILTIVNSIYYCLL